MYDKLCVSERRTKMLEFLGYRRETTRYELAAEFHVSISTIHRDIVYLSSIAPVYTKLGNSGGVFVSPDFRSYKTYLDDIEENYLYSLKGKIADDDWKIVEGIIRKFTRNRNVDR